MKAILAAAALLWVFAGSARGQIAILHIQVVEGEGAVNLAGARISHPLSVAITDETGKPVEGAAVSFHLPEDGPGGVCSNGLRTDVTVSDARGRASPHAMQLNRSPGRFSIRIVASKEQARAGIVSFQYIASGVTKSPPSARRSPLKWVVLAALAAGGAVAAGLTAGRSSGSGSAAPSTAVAATVSIGSPSLTVGKP